MIDEIRKNILNQILKAKQEAIKQGIQARTIVIDKDVALFLGLLCDNHYFAPCIFGLRVDYANFNDFEINGEKVSFIINDKEIETELEQLRRENQELKQKLERLKELL